jgi:hypothetical protein
MTGYTIKKVLPSELILGQPKISIALMIVTLIGILFIALAIMTKLKIINPPETFFNMFLGMGIIFTAGGIIFMFQKIPDTISFNKENSSIIFSENALSYSKPFNSFNKLIIIGKISQSKNGKAAVFQLNLVSGNGSSLLLCESENKAELQKTAESIISYLDIDIIAGGELLHKGTGRYADTPPVYPPRNMMSITTGSAGGSSVYQWNCRKSIGVLFLLGAVIFGFNFVFFTWAFPGMGRLNAGAYAGGAILVVIDIFFTWTFLFYLFGSNIVEISDSVFAYRQRLFGFNINHKTFSHDEIDMISSGFTSDDNKITVFTKRGMDIVNELKIFASLNNLNDTSTLMSLAGKVMELRRNIIEIDGTPLYYYEKLYLENEWSEKLKLADDTHSAY